MDIHQTLDYLAQHILARDILVAVIGLCVGSFLNVLALRTLAERSLWHPPSSCPKCDHRLGIVDLIPVLSYLMLGGKCRYCHATISWQYPVVELSTAVSFVFVVHRFHDPFITIAMIFFVAILIAICVTDFREKLIPHEITYPSILIGLAFANLRDDLLPSLAGVGISYILFDFLAFYGLKTYSFLRGKEDENEDDEEEDENDEQEETKSWFSWGTREKEKSEATAAVRAKTTPAIGFAGTPVKVILSQARKHQFVVPQEENSQSSRAAVAAAEALPGSAGLQTATTEFADGGQAPAGVQSLPNSKAESGTVNGGKDATADDTSPEATELSQINIQSDNVVPTGSHAQSVAAMLVQPESGLARTTAGERPKPFLVPNREKDILVAPRESTFALVAVPAEPGLKKGHTTAGKEASQGGDDQDEELDPEIDGTFEIARSEDEAEEEEDFEVMGGGDAVLAALIAAWLGLQNLGISLVFGFLFGCLMGSVYLGIEMHKAGVLLRSLKAGAAVAALLVVLTEGTLYFYLRMIELNGVTQDLMYLPWILGALAAFGGIFGTIMWNGSSRQFSKPFPFGPALAFGALVALFWDPYSMLRLGLNWEIFIKPFIGA